ncbi:MAG TPA: tetratricopeptide repeat protein [Chryseolinea sp.]|nr:tetratricopeptide repeat protein [Chryseolinea sp.]
MRAIIVNSVFAMLALLPHRGLGQCKDEKWTTDEQLIKTATDQQTLYKNQVSAGNLQQAVLHINWLVTNAPRANGNIYTDGAAVYEKLASGEKDPVKRNTYVHSMLMMYRLQNKNCGTHHDLMTIKALYLHKFIKQSDPAATLALFDSLLDKRGNDVSGEVVVAYMETVKYNYWKFHKLTDDAVLKCYNRAMGIAEYKQREAIRKGVPDDEFLVIKDDVDALLFSMVAIDCNFIKNNLGPRFRQHPDDLSIARKILSFMLQNQCFDDPLWLVAGELLYEKNTQREYTLAKALGLRYFTLKNYEKAKIYLDDALELTADFREKSETLLYLGRIQARTDKPAARKMYMEALDIDRANKEAYERIGDLYYNSADECRNNTNDVDDALVFILAADYYKRSGNDKKVAAAREKFPTKASVTSAGYINGSLKFVECWIQETTTLRTKD